MTMYRIINNKWLGDQVPDEENTIITDAELQELAEGWGKTVEDLDLDDLEIVKMYISYEYTSCKEIYGSLEEAIKEALEGESDGEYIYVNHYVDDDGRNGWLAYIADDGDMDGTRYISIKEYTEDGGRVTGYWDPEWDQKAEITIA